MSDPEPANMSADWSPRSVGVRQAFVTTVRLLSSWVSQRQVPDLKIAFLTGRFRYYRNIRYPEEQKAKVIGSNENNIRTAGVVDGG